MSRLPDDAHAFIETDVTGEASLFVQGEPNEHGPAHDVVFGYKSPEPRVGRVMPVVAYHPVVIHLKGIC